MRKGIVGFLVFLSCGALLVAGCAKKEMVKGEEPVSAATSPAEKAPAKAPGQDAQDAAAREKQRETVKQEPLKEQVQDVAAKEEREAREALEKVYFDYDSYVLSPAARDTLSKDADYLLKKAPSLKVQLEGHCDERGSDEYNMALGEKRAKAAHNYLVTLGVPAARLSIISYGKEKPADPGHDEAAWAKNRRVEFTIIR